MSDKMVRVQLLVNAWKCLICGETLQGVDSILIERHVANCEKELRQRQCQCHEWKYESRNSFMAIARVCGACGRVERLKVPEGLDADTCKTLWDILVKFPESAIEDEYYE